LKESHTKKNPMIFSPHAIELVKPSQFNLCYKCKPTFLIELRLTSAVALVKQFNRIDELVCKLTELADEVDG